MKTLLTTKHTIRFRRWSRKRYSMFCSIGKHVTIGNVKKEITEAALTKQGQSRQTTHGVISFRNEGIEEDNIESTDTLLNQWIELLFPYLFIEYSYNYSKLINKTYFRKIRIAGWILTCIHPAIFFA